MDANPMPTTSLFVIEFHGFYVSDIDNKIERSEKNSKKSETCRAILGIILWMKKFPSQVSDLLNQLLEFVFSPDDSFYFSIN